MKLALLIGLICMVGTSNGFTPYVPTSGFTYYIEAAREGNWPSCQYRFASYPATCDKIDLWKAAGANQQFTFLDAGAGNFYLKTSCGKYLSYPGDCSQKTVDTWAEAGINQKFRFIVGDNTQFNYYIEAVGRASCSLKYLSFPIGCTTSTPDLLDLWSAAGPDQRFRIHPVASSVPIVHNVGTSFPCPDPYVWKPASSSSYMIQCTGGGIGLGFSTSLEPESAHFNYVGDCLGGSIPSWTSQGNRWAPESYEASDGGNYLFFSDSQPDGNHRIGWAYAPAAASSGGPKANAWTQYSSSFMNVGMAPGGDIDQNIFQDTDGRTYMSWKTDDNNVGATTTRLWLQEVKFSNGTVTQIGTPRVIMDSTGLWWVDSWVNGGSLIEGPELVKGDNGMYYLFFASGKYCQDTYMEGVARSFSLWGPYDKMAVPLLSNGVVGYAKDSQGALQKVIGPGHATIVRLASKYAINNDNNNKEEESMDKHKQEHLQRDVIASAGTGSIWRIVWHASLGQVCNRYGFVSRLVFGADGWPYVDL